MIKRKYRDKNGAATAVALRQTAAYKNSTRRIAVVDNGLALMKL